MSRQKHDEEVSATERPKARTAAGHIVLGDVKVECYVLDDGSRVITPRGAVRALTASSATNPKGLGPYLARLPKRFAELAARPSLEFELRERGMARGYPVRWFIELCNAYIEAREAGELDSRQLHLASQAQMFVSAAAIVGVEALVDEACGYIPEGDDSVSARFVRELFRQNPREWKRFWKEDVVSELCRVFGIRQTQAFPAPLMGVVGKLYAMRMGEEAHEELRRVNPGGAERNMHFQHFGEQLFGVVENDLPALRTLLRMSRSKYQFWPLWEMHCTGRGQLRLGW